MTERRKGLSFTRNGDTIVLTATEAWDEAVLAALIAGAGLLGTNLKAGLYTNIIQPSKVLTLADLTEPLYGSYVRQSVVMSAPSRDPDTGIVSLAASLHWQQTGTPLAVTIQGIFYAYAATPVLLGIEPFPQPIPLVDLLSAFDTVLSYVESNQLQGVTTVIQ